MSDGDMVTVPQQHERKVQRKYTYKHRDKSRRNKGSNNDHKTGFALSVERTFSNEIRFFGDKSKFLVGRQLVFIIFIRIPRALGRVRVAATGEKSFPLEPPFFFFGGLKLGGRSWRVLFQDAFPLLPLQTLLLVLGAFVRFRGGICSMSRRIPLRIMPGLGVQEGPACRARTTGASRLRNTRFGDGGCNLREFGWRINGVGSTGVRNCHVIGRRDCWSRQWGRGKVQGSRLKRRR